MTNWLERARCEISKDPNRPTAITASRNLTSVMAVPQRGKSGILGSTRSRIQPTNDRGVGSPVTAKEANRPTAITANRNLPDAVEARLAFANQHGDETDRVELSPLSAWVTEQLRDSAGRLLAVKICSVPLQEHLYVVFDSAFIPPEPLATYSTDEIETMKGKSPEQIVEIHKVKVVFRGARLIQ